MAKHGGKRDRAGRKPKADEVKLIERLSPLDDAAFKELEKGLKAGDFRYLKLFYEYRIGKPRERVDMHIENTKAEELVLVSNGEVKAQPITDEAEAEKAGKSL